MPKPIRARSRLSCLSTASCTFLLSTLLLSVACDDGPSSSDGSPAARAADGPTASATTTSAGDDSIRKASRETPKTAPRHPSERPVPAFTGVTLDGQTLDVRSLLGARSVLFFFNPEIAEAAPVARAVERVGALGADHNFKVVGVGIGSTSAKLAGFVADNGLTFPVIDDSGGSITQKLQLRAPLGILGVDAEGYMSFVLGHFPKGSELEKQVAADLRESLRIADASATANDGALFHWTKAPSLGVVAMSNGEVLETKALAGRPAIVIFFLHTCPHCHKALQSIKETLAALPETERPRLVAISIQNDPSAVRSAMKEHGLDFFDPYLDPGGKAADAWGITGGVPVVHVLDAEGRIRHRGEGWNGARDAGILRMKVAKLAGARVPMLLDPTGYSGNDVCGVCHELEQATWHYTKHASAYDTLVAHGADRRTDCVGCHVVGFEQPGGFDLLRRPPHLEGVGCESCHGRGGPHLSPDFVKGDDYARVCSSCHNPTHSLGFDYATFHPRIAHAKLASLSNEERAALGTDGGAERELLPTRAAYVGSEACRSCHAKEFETWAASPHARAVATLERAGQQTEADCLSCHTTAWDKPGGFAPGTPVASAPDLARVGCESCHGPGGDHVGARAPRVGTILSLGDKCDSCVIQKVCGTCHDKANDPGFEFAVEQRIDAQRHGTIESAATRAERAAETEPVAGQGERPDAG
ncbi:MAG: multiheme c-type cytochrome [Myxococcota bacterium]